MLECSTSNTPNIVCQWAAAITKGHNNNETSKNVMVKFIQMDDKLFKKGDILFKWMKNYQIE
jgi:hypothetical protein